MIPPGLIPLASPVPGVEIGLDAASGRWRVAAGQARWLRPWRWAERRRMLAASARGGRLDGMAFAQALCATLYEPPPPAPLVPLHALLALELLGVADGPAPAPLGAAEARLAGHFGWTPGTLAEEPAAALDALLTGLDVPGPAQGWNRIQVLPDDAPDA